MVDFIILIKKKGSKKFIGGIPTARGVSIKALKAIVRRVSKRFVAKIVTKAVFMRLRAKIGKIKRVVRKVRKKRIKRRVRRVKRKIKRRRRRKK